MRINYSSKRTSLSLLKKNVELITNTAGRRDLFESLVSLDEYHCICGLACSWLLHVRVKV
jgi:hypothetical protein